MVNKIREYWPVVIGAVVVGAIEKFWPVQAPAIEGCLGVAGLLIMAAFKVSRIIQEERSGCVVYRLDRE